MKHYQGKKSPTAKQNYTSDDSEENTNQQLEQKSLQYAQLSKKYFQSQNKVFTKQSQDLFELSSEEEDPQQTKKTPVGNHRINEEKKLTSRQGKFTPQYNLKSIRSQQRTKQSSSLGKKQHKKKLLKNKQPNEKQSKELLEQTNMVNKLQEELSEQWVKYTKLLETKINLEEENTTLRDQAKQQSKLTFEESQQDEIIRLKQNQSELLKEINEQQNITNEALNQLFSHKNKANIEIEFNTQQLTLFYENKLKDQEIYFQKQQIEASDKQDSQLSFKIQEIKNMKQELYNLEEKLTMEGSEKQKQKIEIEGLLNKLSVQQEQNKILQQELQNVKIQFETQKDKYHQQQKEYQNNNNFENQKLKKEIQEKDILHSLQLEKITKKMKDLSNELEKVEIYEKTITDLEQSLQLKDLEIQQIKKQENNQISIEKLKLQYQLQVKQLKKKFLLKLADFETKITKKEDEIQQQQDLIKQNKQKANEKRVKWKEIYTQITDDNEKLKEELQNATIINKQLIQQIKQFTGGKLK